MLATLGRRRGAENFYLLNELFATVFGALRQNILFSLAGRHEVAVLAGG